MRKAYKYLPGAIFAVAIWCFWAFLYPHALGFYEQNQLFVFTWAHLLQCLGVAGGFADYLTEFFIQFNVIGPAGPILMTALMVIIHLEVYKLGRDNELSYALSFIPPVLLTLCLGNIFTNPCFPVAIAITLAWTLIYRKAPSIPHALVAIPALLWLAGPVAWIFVGFVILDAKKPAAGLYAVYTAAVAALIAMIPMRLWPAREVILGQFYFSVPLEHPAIHFIAAISAFAVPVLSWIRSKSPIIALGLFVLVMAGGWLGSRKAFDKDTYEIIAYDQLIRHEKWFEVVDRAEKYQPQREEACVSVNLALYMSGQQDRIGEFYQCGTRGLLMPRVRNNISNVSTGEAFYRMGMINESLRYAFDSQESIPSKKKSPRFLMRMAECQIINGRYEVASKYLDILGHTLFYRGWAADKEKYLNDDAMVMSDPIYAYLSTVRENEDFLYNYPAMEQMLYKLFMQDNGNVMAGWYCITWHNLSNGTIDEEADTDSVHGS